MSSPRNMIEMPYGMVPATGAEASDRAGELALAAGALAFASGVVHLALIVPHLRESVALAVLFSLAGAGEIAWSIAFVRSRNPVLGLLGGALMLLVAGGWLLSRTVGLPFGIDPGPPEAFGLLDCLTTACELFGAYALLRQRDDGRSTGVAYAGLTLAVLLLLSLVTLGHHAIS